MGQSAMQTLSQQTVTDAKLENSVFTCRRFYDRLCKRERNENDQLLRRAQCCCSIMAWCHWAGRAFVSTLRPMRLPRRSNRGVLRVCPVVQLRELSDLKVLFKFSLLKVNKCDKLVQGICVL